MKSGYIDSDKDAKAIYINIMVITVVLSTVVFPLVGKLCDSVDPRKIVPVAFSLRSASTYFFY